MSLGEIDLLSEIDSLSKIHTLQRKDIDGLMIEFSRRILAVMRIERMSVWLFNKGQSAIISIGEYHLPSRKFSKGSKLESIKYPSYFKAISENQILLVENIFKNPATVELSEDYSLPNQIISLMDIPIRIGGNLIGVMCFEKTGLKERIFSKEEQVFALSTAAILSSTMEARYRRALQYKLDEELQEKNLLIKEIHHRVKNNLSVVSSLLNLQSQKSKDVYHQHLFDECKSKIDSIASIHDAIYRSKSYAEINVFEYFSKMLKNLSSLYSARERGIKMSISIQHFTLQLEQALPLALVVNEVITNAFKHAFASSSGGTIIFRLHHMDDQLMLEISDNGSGIHTKDPKKSSLGMDIISGLAGKLNAEYAYHTSREGGTVFNLSMAYKKLKRRKKQV